MVRRATATAAVNTEPCIALSGGPAHGHWYLLDWWESQPAGSHYRAGYVKTAEKVENPEKKLRTYGLATVYRFDSDQVPTVAKAEQLAPEPWWKANPVHCDCGNRLLLPDRECCERCRLGLPAGDHWPYDTRQLGHNDAAWWDQIGSFEPAPDAPEAMDQVPEGEDTGEAVPVTPAPTPGAVRHSPVEVAAFVWSCVAHLYDR